VSALQLTFWISLREVVLGGAETLYPAYRKKLKDTYVAPAKCPANCGYGAFTTNASQ